jgi:hypothetical protein
MMFCKFANKTIIFQKDLQFQEVVMLCYNRQIVMKVIRWLPPPLTLHIAHQILRIIVLKLTLKIFFLFVGILANLKRCCLQTNYLKNLIFMNKN